MPQSQKTASRPEAGEKRSLWRQTRILTALTIRRVVRRIAGWSLPCVPVRSGRTKRDEDDWFAFALFRNCVPGLRAVLRNSASGAGLSTRERYELDVSPAERSWSRCSLRWG